MRMNFKGLLMVDDSKCLGPRLKFDISWNIVKFRGIDKFLIWWEYSSTVQHAVSWVLFARCVQVESFVHRNPLKRWWMRCKQWIRQNGSTQQFNLGGRRQQARYVWGTLPHSWWLVQTKRVWSVAQHRSCIRASIGASKRSPWAIWKQDDTRSSRRQRWNMMKVSTGYWRCCHLMPSFKRHLAIRSRLVPSFANAKAQSGRLSKSRLVSRSACPATCLGVRVSMFPWLLMHQGCRFVPCMIHLRKQSQRWHPEVNINVCSQMFPEFPSNHWHDTTLVCIWWKYLHLWLFVYYCLLLSLTLEDASTWKRYVKWHQVHMLLSTCSSSVY